MTDALAEPPGAVADPARGRASILSPYDIAYLRGGTREFLKLRLLELVHAGYLVVREKHRGRKTERRLAATSARVSHLAAMDEYLIEQFRNPLTASEIHNLDFPDDLAALCGKARQKLIDQGLLAGWIDPDSAGPKLIILLLAISFFTIAIMLVGNVVGNATAAFIVVAVLAGASFLVVTALLSYRRTSSGKRELRDIENDISAAHGGLIRMGANIDEQQFLAVAVHGLVALATSELDALAALFGDANPPSYYGTQHAGRENGSGGCGGCGCGGCGG